MSVDNDLSRYAAFVANLLSAGAIIGAIIGYLPYVAAAAAFIWYLIQIWESRTVQHWYQTRNMVRKAKKVARLTAKKKVIVAQLDALEKLRQAKIDARESVEQARVEAAKQEIQESINVASKEND